MAASALADPAIAKEVESYIRPSLVKLLSTDLFRAAGEESTMRPYLAGMKNITFQGGR